MPQNYRNTQRARRQSARIWEFLLIRITGNSLEFLILRLWSLRDSSSESVPELPPSSAPPQSCSPGAACREPQPARAAARRELQPAGSCAPGARACQNAARQKCSPPEAHFCVSLGDFLENNYLGFYSNFYYDFTRILLGFHQETRTS